ncbi:penicillin-insensitive murein endopeptidase [Antarcticirhabdus aurantiaca]|uniref:Penicillin-insensitive murein endopeptidase n=1 Tax=Antarcticirhabdus aurantiaca TaxID=2606717 RepID=A0ACD4NKA8_9HYPH|nr:penicillin-insensitive murein endopeptidase [Antarcticirhabdus aurantiaca]WAJ27214.1 penicillin-insensitive murein endopeptidase [Jeongeuplla avenae]
MRLNRARTSTRRLGLSMALAVTLLDASGAIAAPAAKDLFGAQHSASAMPTESIGFYSKGCLAGGAQLPTDGPTWQVMRLERDRRYGHPAMIALLQRFAADVTSKDGWSGLLVGDISQARGGPMAFGHASHQIGLDADIWLTPMPNRRLSREERADMPFTSVLKDGTTKVDERKWSPTIYRILRRAASYGEVERIFVHPGIKRKLCSTAPASDRAWLSKVRPAYGHDAHFHIRMKCQPGSPNCEPQRENAGTDDCGAPLDWWFNVALKPASPPKPGAKPPKPKPPMTLAALPRECRVVLDAPGRTPDGGSAPAMIAASPPIAPGAPTAAGFAPDPGGAGSFPPLPLSGVPTPSERPFN